MQKRYPCGGIGRRQFLAGAAAALPVLSALHVSAAEPKAARDPGAPRRRSASPAPIPAG